MVVRATAVCLHKSKLLLVKQTFKDMGTFWSLPGGKVEAGETLTEATIRETKEETGITISVGRLLYVSQRFNGTTHIVQVLFEASYKSGKIGKGLSLTTNEVVSSVKFVPFKDLEKYGITKLFADKVRSHFPDAGTYSDSMEQLGL